MGSAFTVVSMRTVLNCGHPVGVPGKLAVSRDKLPHILVTRSVCSRLNGESQINTSVFPISYTNFKYL